MSDEPIEEAPPEDIARGGDPSASTTTELPVVVLGESEFHRTAPRKRLLLGRVHERWILYPVYALELLAGLLAVQFAMTHREWSPVPLALAWGMLYLWNWFYGVAYRYRRFILKYTSVFAVLGTSSALAYFCLERAAAQTALGPTDLMQRAEAPALVWSAALTMIATALLMAHVVWLGRGYREKNEAHRGEGRD